MENTRNATPFLAPDAIRLQKIAIGAAKDALSIQQIVNNVFELSAKTGITFNAE